MRRMAGLVGLILVALCAGLPVAAVAAASSGRSVIDLAGPGWKLWLDRAAVWKTDPLHLPPVAIERIPATQPTGGWQGMYARPATAVAVPGTVEEYHWGDQGDPYGTAGNYQGVSFWWRDLAIPRELAGKTLILRFAACRLRAEVYLDEQLVGYDCIGNTPFEVDVTRHARPGQVHRLCVRITDPNDNEPRLNFDWADYGVTPWGSQRVPSSHGFGGITGRVQLQATDAVHISDVHVRNKPTPSPQRPTDAEVEVEVTSRLPATQPATLALRIAQRGRPESVVFERTPQPIPVPPGRSVHRIAVQAPQARVWDLDSPTLYDCTASLEAGPAGPGSNLVMRDSASGRFGFRWFAPDGVGTPTACLRLNGRRIVVRSAISWGYWPVNGIFPTAELAERQVRSAKALGLNAVSMHRTIADPLVLEKADELGLLIYAEPGGYKCDYGDAAARSMATEKLMRMVRRDRNHPSVVVWGMINEIWVRELKVWPEFLRDIVDAHQLDPSRTIVLVSGQKANGLPNPAGSWMMPYETIRREVGWYNEHHAGGLGVWCDDRYVAPLSYYLNDGPPNAIVYWGEEHAIPSPPQLDSMVKLYDPARLGWDGHDYVRMNKAYAEWLAGHDRHRSFAGVDELCRSLADVAHYAQGRIIESVRMGDVTDGYVINGWECMKLDNHSGVVDVFRRPKGNPAILAHYNQPLYLAVKLRTKVLETGGRTVCDVFIINEKDVRGEHELRIAATGPDGRELLRKSYPAAIAGGDRFGELLLRDLVVPVGEQQGYVRVRAELAAGDRIVAQGGDEAFAVDLSCPIPEGIAVIDPTAVLSRFLATLRCVPAVYAAGQKAPPVLLAGMQDPRNNPLTAAALEHVSRDGTTLVALWGAEHWAAELARRGLVRFEGVMALGNNWLGGSYFALKHPLLRGLPQAQGMNWEYQAIQRQFSPPPHRRHGLALVGDDAAAGCFNHHEFRLASAISVIRHGKGRVILSTLPLMNSLLDGRPQAAMAKRMVLNYIAYGPACEGSSLPPATRPASGPATATGAFTTESRSHGGASRPPG